jgi:flavin-dependent dehydrogenase
MADRKFRVVVAGAGVSGLFMAETLKRAGSDFAVYEKAGEGRSQRRAKLSSSPPLKSTSHEGTGVGIGPCS